MFRRILFPLLLGVSGVAVLLWLGVWQVERLAWKRDVLAGIDARMTAAPVPFTTDVTRDADNYRAVTLAGTTLGRELHVLTSGTAAGTGYRVIAALTTTAGTPIMVDLGLLPLAAKDAGAAYVGPMQITGNLIWPDDQNSSTPEPDPARNIWFARNVDTMAQALDTAPLMVAARTTSPADPRMTPLPVDTAGIKNDHLEYAITWFLLAAVWAAMTLYLILRTLRQKDA